jgi:NTP pyrophosphatase (non-canonical NTP hydrolase)
LLRGIEMDADTYQRLAARTLIDGPDFEISPRDFMAVWDALGIGGEAGELADLVRTMIAEEFSILMTTLKVAGTAGTTVDNIKKSIMHQRGLNVDKIKRELGDELWYIAALCTTLGFSMSEVMQINVDKLKARYPDGWDHTRSGVREGEAR